MTQQIIDPLGYTKAFAANEAGSAFTKRQSTIVQPTGGGVFAVPAGYGRDWLEIVAFGTGTDGQTFNYRLSKYRNVLGLFVPTRIIDVSCTLANPVASPAPVGVAGKAVTDNDIFCDQQTVTSGVSEFVVVNTADDTPAFLMVPLLGAEIIRLELDMTGAASGNVLLGIAR